MTVLGEYVLPGGGGAWTQSLMAALAALGVREKAARQAIARLHEQGWLERNRVGRQTRWHLTPDLTRLLTVGADRIYGFGQVERPWDERWVVLLVSVPEPERSARYRMTVRLRWAGFGSLGQGTWLSPWVDDEAAAVGVLDELGLAGTSFRATLGELGDAHQLADQAWDLDALRLRYDEFLRDADRLVAATAPRGPLLPAAALSRLVHRWRQFPFVDPDLPTDLLPGGWPGATAAARFTELRERWRNDAGRWWLETDTAFGSEPGQGPA
ncbi:MAG: PaaX family transcriptional regulator C-terminal domain-containing protein [Acidimicrobiales bacterium]